MTKRQKLIALWLASVGRAATENGKRAGLPQTRCEWDGFVDDDEDEDLRTEPTVAEMDEVVGILSKDYHC